MEFEVFGGVVLAGEEFQRLVNVFHVPQVVQRVNPYQLRADHLLLTLKTLSLLPSSPAPSVLPIPLDYVH